MPASEAQIRSNQANSLKSSGPKTPEGKEQSRSNSYKHSMTGAGIVMPEEDAAEVERLALALQADLKPPGPAGSILTRRIAVLSVRMDRSFIQECAAIGLRVRTVMDEFKAPEGVNAETAERLRVQAGKIATFDSSKPACLARKYEAAAERGFFRALKELRELTKKRATVTAPVAEADTAEEAVKSKELASFLRIEKELTRLEAQIAKDNSSIPPKSPQIALSGRLPGARGAGRRADPHRQTSLRRPDQHS